MPRTAIELNGENMGPTIPHQDQIYSAIDRYFDAERNLVDARRDLAQTLVATWLDQANAGDQANATRVLAQSEKPLTLDELAARLGKTKRTIQEWVSDHGLPDLRAHPAADPLFD